MKACQFQYLYGPVASWRLGSSLGIDPISAREKICTFDCIYCQLGKTKVFSDERREFIPVKRLLDEIEMLSPVPIDYITFSGAGEPTLASNLGDMIKAVRQIRKEKIAVITNTSLLNRADVRGDLALADFVLAKLDAWDIRSFWEVNRPMRDIRIDAVIESLKEFRALFKQRLALQMMFVENNKNDATRLARIADEIKPDEVQINTPLRACAVQPLPESEMAEIENCLKNICGETMVIHNVYKAEKKKVLSVSAEDTLRRRGKS